MDTHAPDERPLDEHFAHEDALVDDDGRDSFPASDPPGHWAGADHALPAEAGLPPRRS